MIALETQEDRIAAAGEYVLGTLNDEDLKAFVTAMSDDEALLAEVYVWQDRLLGLSLRADAATTRPQLWQRIAASQQALSAWPGASPASVAPTRVRWWQRLAPWQGLTTAAFAAAMLFAVVLLQRGGWNERAPERYLAVLQSPTDRSAGWVVEGEPTHGVRLVALAGATAAPPGRALQFWTKPQGAAGPTSLGLVRPDQPIDLPASRLPGLGDQQLFEITLEPEAGSPIGKPTGPILFVGRTVHL